MTYTTTLDRSEYLTQLEPALDETQRLVESRQVVFRDTTSLLTQRTLTAFRQAQHHHGIARIAQSILLEGAYRSEIASANSADLMLTFTLELVRQLTKSINAGGQLSELRAEMDESVERLRRKLQERVHEFDGGQLREAVGLAVKDDRLSEMVMTAIDLSGLGGRIFPSHTHNAEYSVELVDGYTFEAGSYPEFYKANGQWSADNFKLLIIDGVIDRVSEIDTLLTEVVKKRVPIMIVARGFNEEVIATLGANRKRGTIDVLPIRIPFEVDVVNLITDIAIVCGAVPLTPMKGDSTSRVRLDDLVEVEHVLATAAGTLTITNKRTSKAVHNHATLLQKRRDEQHAAKMSELLNKRIRTLFSRCVHLRVASKSEQERLQDLEAIDYGLRTAKAALANGIENVSSLSTIPRGTMMMHALKSFDHFDEYRPVKSIFSAIHHGVSVAFTLASIEYAVVVDG